MCDVFLWDIHQGNKDAEASTDMRIFSAVFEGFSSSKADGIMMMTENVTDVLKTETFLGPPTQNRCFRTTSPNISE